MKHTSIAMTNYHEHSLLMKDESILDFKLEAIVVSIKYLNVSLCFLDKLLLQRDFFALL
jgi:hypothetical protein